MPVYNHREFRPSRGGQSGNYRGGLGRGRGGYGNQGQTQRAQMQPGGGFQSQGSYRGSTGLDHMRRNLNQYRSGSVAGPHHYVEANYAHYGNAYSPSRYEDMHPQNTQMRNTITEALRGVGEPIHPQNTRMRETITEALRGVGEPIHPQNTRMRETITEALRGVGDPIKDGLLGTPGGGLLRTPGDGLLCTPGTVDTNQAGLDEANANELIQSLGQLSVMGSNAKLALNVLDMVMNSGSSRIKNQETHTYASPASDMRHMDLSDVQTYHHQGYPMPVQKTMHFSKQRHLQYNAKKTSASNQVSFPTNVLKKKNKKPYKVEPKTQNSQISKAISQQSSTNSKVKHKPKSKTSSPKIEKLGKSDDKKEHDQQANKEPNQDSKIEKQGNQDSKTEKQVNQDSKNFKQGQEAIPLEALKCHICGLNKFTYLMSFIAHTESKNHAEMLQVYHEKGFALLQLLRAEAKLACQREMEKARRAGAKGPIRKCFQCQCPYVGEPQKHNKTMEHQLVENYLHPKCCGRVFPNRIKLEEHRVSLIHLKKEMQLDMQKEPKEQQTKKRVGDRQEDSSTSGDVDKVRESLEQLRLTHKEGILSAATLPPYDPANPIGLKFIGKATKYECKVCWDVLEPLPKEAVTHCRSKGHYNKVASHLTSTLDYMARKKDKVKTTKKQEKTGKTSTDDDEKKIGNASTDEDEQKTVTLSKSEDKREAKEVSGKSDDEDARNKATSSSNTSKAASDDGDAQYEDVDDDTDSEQETEGKVISSKMKQKLSKTSPRKDKKKTVACSAGEKSVNEVSHGSESEDHDVADKSTGSSDSSSTEESDEDGAQYEDVDEDADSEQEDSSHNSNDWAEESMKEEKPSDDRDTAKDI